MNEFGYFEGEIHTKWNEDGRHMTLINEVKYVDPSSIIWIAPAGSITDGASIPQIAWTFVGGPFEGKYRKAAVFHDVACVEKSREWKQVHRMFYTAMRAAEVPDLKAKQMYAAVYAFGPKWVLREVKKFNPPFARRSDGNRRIETARTVVVPMSAPLSEENPDDVAKFEQVEQKIETENLTLEEIEALVQTKD